MADLIGREKVESLLKLTIRGIQTNEGFCQHPDLQMLFISLLNAIKHDLQEIPAVKLEECKSADEMFLELGYERAPAPYFQIIYKNSEERTEIIYFYGSGVFECFYDGELICMNVQEVLACAQLIKEMEANYAETVGK